MVKFVENYWVWRTKNISQKFTGFMQIMLLCKHNLEIIT